MEDCSWNTQFRALQHRFPLTATTTNTTIVPDDEETKLRVRVLLYSMLQMWWVTERYLGMEEEDGAVVGGDEQTIRMIRWYLQQIWNVFYREDGKTPQEIRDLFELAVRVVSVRSTNQQQQQQQQQPPSDDDDGDFSSEVFRHTFLPQIQTAIQQVGEEESLNSTSTNSGGNAHRSKTKKKKHPYRLFLDEDLQECLFRHHDDHSLITDDCTLAMDAAPIKIQELQLESLGLGFTIVFHGVFFGMNFIALIGLLAYGSARARTERRLEKRRKSLQQQLTDPFLRHCLEHRLSRVPDDDQQQVASAIRQLEQTLLLWDSRARSEKVLNRQLHQFRTLALFALGTSTVAYVWLWIFDMLLSMARCLETWIFSTSIVTASYALPLGAGSTCRSSNDTEAASSSSSSLIMEDYESSSEMTALREDPPS
jgi:hypothetical protein